MIETSEHLAMLLALESELDVDAHTFSESAIPLWSYVRWPLARALFRAVFPDESAVGGHAARSLGARARLAANAARDARWPRGARPIALVSTTVSCVMRDGRYFNRLVEHFAEARAAESLIIEESADDRRRAPRSFPAVASLDALATWASIEAKMTRLRARDRAAIDALLARVARALPVLRPEAIAPLRATLEGVARRLPALRRGFDWFVARSRPRLLIVEGASYGAFAHFMLWARERAIVTAEHQHGLISPNHEAYNFADAVVGTRFQETLPEHFLAYGPAWMRGVRLPSRVEQIGNPDLSVAAAQLARDAGPEARRVLFISSAMDPERYQRVIARVSAALASIGATVALRPHPIERPVAAERYRAALALANVELDVEPSLHRSIARSRAVLGDFSTSLFEALAIGRPTAVLDGAQSRQHVDRDALPFVHSDEEAAQFALDATRASLERPARATPSAYWAEGWRDAYRAFTQRALDARLLFAP